MTAGPDCEPHWRDNPDALDALCEEGARDLHGEQAVPRDVTVIEPPEEYL